MSLLPGYSAGKSYGMWGYQGACCDMAIAQDSVEMLKECIEKGFVNDSCETFDQHSIRSSCRRRKAEKCDQYLQSIGWKE